MAESYTADGASYDLADVGRHWHDELQGAARYFKDWIERCKKIEKLYLDQRNESSGSNPAYPMLWSNISVLQPAVYARTPQPAVDRRFKDSDPVGRVASQMLERGLDFLLETANLDSLMRQCRDDFLLTARCVAWLRYEADISPLENGVEPSEPANEGYLSGGMGDNGGPPLEEITDERVAVDYVHWSDFLHSPARRWEDVTWVARRVHMDKEDFVARFGQEALEIAGATDNNRTSGSTDADRAQNEGKIGVWEIWCKTENYTVWLAEGSTRALEVSPPPLDLENFWPCPKPAFGTLGTSSLVPVPDYRYYQDQVAEIDKLTIRIAKLTDQLRLKIFYPSGDGAVSPAIEAAMKPTNDTIMVPIPEWTSFVERGGSNSVITLPIDEVQKVITACIANRKQLIDDIFQITGISDIVRGDTEASETATAQRIKTQWGSARIRDRQMELARFARDIVRIAGEIVCNNFQPETLVAMTGMQLPTMQQKQQAQMMAQQVASNYQRVAQAAQAAGQQPPPPPQPPAGFAQMMQQPTIDEVMALLRSDSSRGFRIDIETDSTIEPDEDAEKQRRMEFAKVVGDFVQQAAPLAQATPELVPFMVSTLLWVSRGFRAGRELESALEDAGQAMIQKASAPPAPPQPSPDEQVKLQTTQIKANAEQQKARDSLVETQMEHQMSMREIAAQAEVQRQEHALHMQENDRRFIQQQGQNARQPQNGGMLQ